MLISQMTTQQAKNILVSITPFINNILSDDECMKIVRETVDADKANSTLALIAYGVDKVNQIVPLLLDKHENDIYNILSILNEKTVDEIKEQNILVTMKQIKEICKDKELIDFFK